MIAFREAVKQALPEGGFTIRDRRDPSPQVSRTLERLRQFLTLVGLTALLVGGVGIANAVATYIDRRRKVIAAFKSLGATAASSLACTCCRSCALRRSVSSSAWVWVF